MNTFEFPDIKPKEKKPIWWRRWFLVLVVLLIGWLAARDIQNRMNKQRAYPVIKELGGRITSLTPPVPFSGSELYFAFYETQFKPGDLQRLSVLEPLTSINYVGVMFKDTNITREEVIELRKSLPNCMVFRVVDGVQQDDK